MRILALETLLQGIVIVIIMTVSGFLLEQLGLVLVQRLLGLKDVTLLANPSAAVTIVQTGIFLVLVLVFLFWRNISRIDMQAPLNLLAADRVVGTTDLPSSSPFASEYFQVVTSSYPTFLEAGLALAGMNAAEASEGGFASLPIVLEMAWDMPDPSDSTAKDPLKAQEEAFTQVHRAMDAASPILTKVLAAMGAASQLRFFLFLAGTMGIWSLLYFLVFQSTAKVYQHIGRS